MRLLGYAIAIGTALLLFLLGIIIMVYAPPPHEVCTMQDPSSWSFIPFMVATMIACFTAVVAFDERS